MNQRKTFAGIEQGAGKNEDDVLLVIRRDMMSDGKECILKNYGIKCVLIREKVHEISVA